MKTNWTEEAIAEVIAKYPEFNSEVSLDCLRGKLSVRAHNILSREGIFTKEGFIEAFRQGRVMRPWATRSNPATFFDGMGKRTLQEVCAWAEFDWMQHLAWHPFSHD
jgi:hypothetical protein